MYKDAILNILTTRLGMYQAEKPKSPKRGSSFGGGRRKSKRVEPAPEPEVVTPEEELDETTKMRIGMARQVKGGEVELLGKALETVRAWGPVSVQEDEDEEMGITTPGRGLKRGAGAETPGTGRSKRARAYATHSGGPKTQ